MAGQQFNLFAYWTEQRTHLHKACMDLFNGFGSNSGGGAGGAFGAGWGGDYGAGGSGYQGYW